MGKNATKPAGIDSELDGLLKPTVQPHNKHPQKTPEGSHKENAESEKTQEVQSSEISPSLANEEETKPQEPGYTTAFLPRV
jgi:hypothetical protein